MDQANNYYSRKLYDPAIDNYKKALSCKETKSCRYKMLQAYKKRSQDMETYGSEANNEYIDELESVFSKYSDDYKLAIQLSDAMKKDEDYEEAYKVLVKAKQNGSDNKALNKRMRKLKYMNHLDETGVSDHRPFYDGKSSVFKGMGWATMDAEGTLENGFENKYQNQMNSDGCLLVQKSKEVLLYDGDEKVLGRFGTEVEDATMYSENRIAIKVNGKYRVYDKTGKKKYGEYDYISTFKDGKAVVLENGRWSLIDASGEVIKKLNFDKVIFDNGGFYSNSDVIVASKGNKYSLYDEDFKKIIEEDYDEIDKPTSDRLYAVKKDNFWGFINDEGDMIIKPRYEGAKSFSNGIAAVKKDGKWGFINKKNQLIVKNEYEDADYFTSKGTCFVKSQDAYEESGFIWKLLKFNIGLPK